MRMKNKFNTKSEKLQLFLSINGIEPLFYVGEYAVYKQTKKLNLLLDEYYIQFVIMKTRLNSL